MDAQPTNAPGASKLSGHELRTIYAMRDGGAAWRAVTEAVGWSDHNIVRNLYNRARLSGALASALGEDAATATATGERKSTEPVTDTGETLRIEQTADGAMTIEAPSSSLIRTLDDLLTIAAVDLDLWAVERQALNAWGCPMKGPDGEPRLVQLHQVKAWLTPRRDVVNARAVIDDMLADAAGHMPRYAVPVWTKPADHERHLWVISPADLHMGMLAWKAETGEDYDSYIAADIAEQAITDLLGKAAGFPAEQIILVLGNDLYHADRTNAGAGGQTTAGTSVDVDTRWQKLFTAGRRMAVQMVDMCRAVAPVEVAVIQGNHSGTVEFYLGDSLQSWYRNDSAVTVRNDPYPRQYYRFGCNLLGFAHGHKEKARDLPLLMAQEASALDWGETTTRDWLLGHLHRKGADEEEHTGVRLIVMPSLAPPDAWHAGQGYQHRRACEARIYHHDDGLAATVSWGPKRSESLGRTGANS